MFFLEFHKEFWNYVKEQSNFHVVAILEEMDGLLKTCLFIYLFIYFNLFNVDVLFFYNNIAILHTNMPIHYKKINIKIYATDKSKKIKKSQCES